MQFYLNNLGILNALGSGKTQVLKNLLAGSRQGLRACDWVPDKQTCTAAVTADLPSVPASLESCGSRNLQLAIAAVEQIRSDIGAAIGHYGAQRIAVVAGTSTSGIAEGEAAVANLEQKGKAPSDYHYRQQEIGNLAELLAEHLQLAGPAYTLSTACSSSAHALGSARRLLAAGLVDAVVVGGADSLCRLTVNGFSALESVAEGVANPFSRNRSGINIGEGAAFFLMTREPGAEGIELLGVGASSDAHHISAPEPSGAGAERAIREALAQAQLGPEAVDYVNLHGTGTRLNDAMEAGVMVRLFGEAVPCSSSKGQIGHTLGAAGATEAGLCWLALSSYNAGGLLPPHCWDGERDPELAPVRLVEQEMVLGKLSEAKAQTVFLSSSFAFGGNNAAVLIGRTVRNGKAA
jgi:3-oxoacyl-[acyl-carrier-protein] synthase-1